MLNRWWRTPQLHSDEEARRERKTGWLELFFDLVFVAVVAELSHTLAEDITWAGLGQFIFLFIPAWWVWIGNTFYNDRFEMDDVSQRLVTFLLMLAIAGLALNAHYGMDKTAQGFAISYIAARVIITLQWLRGGLSNKIAQPMTTRYAIGFSISIALWTISLWVDTPFKFVLWGIGLTFDLLTPLATRSIQARLPALTTSHLPERFGLFYILVLGESVIAAISGVSEGLSKLTLHTAITGGLGLALAFSFWWIYFDGIATRPRNRGFWPGFLWGYSHMLLLMALTANGAGVLKLVSFDGDQLPDKIRWLVCGAVAATLSVIAFIEYLATSHDQTAALTLRTLRLGAAALALLLGLVGAFLDSALLLALLVALCLVQIGYDTYLRYNSPQVTEVEREKNLV